MAKFGKFVDAFISIDGQDLSDHCKSVSLPMSAAMLDASCMGDLTKVNLSGLKEWNMTVELVQDYAAGSVDETLWNVLDAGEPVNLIVRPKSDARGAGNPEFTMSGSLQTYNPASGAHGALLLCSAVFQCSGSIGRSVTP